MPGRNPARPGRLLAILLAGFAGLALPASPVVQRATAQDERPATVVAELSWQRSDTSVTLLNGGRMVWTHVHDAELGKPFMRVGLLDGTELTRPWPIPPGYPKRDHTWHRALWWSWKAIDGTNFWEENQQGTTPTEVDVVCHDDFSATIEMALAYRLPDATSLVKEQRTIYVAAPDGSGSYAIDWQATFTPSGDADVVFNRNGYGGLAIRMAAEFSGGLNDNISAWKFLSSNEPEGVRRGAARWMGYHGVAQNGRPAAIVIFTHPQNPQFPPPWCVRDRYPYLNPCFLAVDNLTLSAGQSLALRYQIHIHAGAVDVDRFGDLWRRFAETPDAGGS